MNRNLLTLLGISQDSKQALRNPWVLGWVGFVMVVLAVNVGLIMLSQYSNPGLVDKNYYDHGRDFERNALKQTAARASLGWEARLETPEHIVVAQPVSLHFTVIDGRGLPLSDADITITAYRPADAAADFMVPMRHVSSGRYQADISFPLKGTWDLIVKVKRGADGYDLTRRVSVHQA
ncbi:MAG: FixH family protein [Gallionella sp.]